MTTPKGPKQEVGLIGGVEKRVIEIVSYQNDWPKRFQELASSIQAELGSHVLAIEHVGSTSVPGLAAKPIIDILVVVENPALEDLYLPKMLALGYELRVREPDFFEHRMFRTPSLDVHVHFYPQDCPENERYLLFRDYLRRHPDGRDAYASLKKQLSHKDWADMNEYAEAKTSFIENCIKNSKSEQAFATRPRK